MITKNELVLDAFEQLRISGLTSKPQPSELVSAVRRLDSMVLAWQNQGICLGYNKSVSYSDVAPLQISGITDPEALAVVLNLAKTLAPSYGKQLDRMMLGDAKTAYDGLFSVDLTMREPDTFLPEGEGNAIRGTRHYLTYQAEEDEPSSDCSVNDILIGQTDVYTTDFEDYLLEIDGDTIASYTAVEGGGAKLLNVSSSESIVSMVVQGVTIGVGQITVTVTTSSGRVLPRAVEFDVKAV